MRPLYGPAFSDTLTLEHRTEKLAQEQDVNFIYIEDEQIAIEWADTSALRSSHGDSGIWGRGLFSNSMFDVWMLIIFGAAGYCFAKLRCGPAPMLLGFILGPMMEEHLRRALLLSRGNAMVLIERPISAAMLLLAALLLIAPALSIVRWRREEIFAEEN